MGGGRGGGLHFIYTGHLSGVGCVPGTGADPLPCQCGLEPG